MCRKSSSHMYLRPVIYQYDKGRTYYYLQLCMDLFAPTLLVKNNDFLKDLLYCTFRVKHNRSIVFNHGECLMMTYYCRVLSSSLLRGYQRAIFLKNGISAQRLYLVQTIHVFLYCNSNGRFILCFAARCEFRKLEN